MKSLRSSLPLVLALSMLLAGALMTGGCRQTTPGGSTVQPSQATADSGRLDEGESADHNREVVTLQGAELLVTLQPGTDPAVVAGSHQLTWVRTLKSDPDTHLLAASSAEIARATQAALARDKRVRRVYLNQPSRNQPFTQ